MANYVYYIVKFESITDCSDSYRFVIRPNNSKTQLVGVSESYPSREAAIEGIRQMKGFVTPEIKDEAEKLVDETEHFKIWNYRNGFMFLITNNDITILTSANAYGHKQNCKDEMISLLCHLDGEVKCWDEPDELRLDRDYFGVK